MEFQLRQARRGEIYARCLMFAESGQGKTYSALAVAHHLADLYGWDPSVIAVLDTETVESADRNDEGTGSAEKYTGRPCNCNRCHRQGLIFDGFQTMIMEEGHRGPEAFQRAIEVCKQAGIKILLLDGITDEWRSLLKLVDNVREQSRGKEDGWSVARPLHNNFVRAIMEYPGHVITTCRAKKESRHKKAEEGLGDVLPDQDSNVIYEYDVAVFFKRGTGYVVKTRDDRLEGANSRHPGADLAEGLKRWCDDPRAKKQSATAEHAAVAPRIPETAPNTRTDAGGRRPAAQGPDGPFQQEARQPDPTQGGADRPSGTKQNGSAQSGGTEQRSNPAEAAKRRILRDVNKLPEKPKRIGMQFLAKAGDDMSKLEKLVAWVDRELKKAVAQSEPQEDPPAQNRNTKRSMAPAQKG